MVSREEADRHAARAPWQRLFIALDTTDFATALALVKRLKHHVGGFKIGKEFFTSHGPQGVSRLRQEHACIFLDLKFHDIPHTVASAVRAAMALSPFMVNIHALGGKEMMLAAGRALADASRAGDPNRPLLLAVTVLTSLLEQDLKALGVEGSVSSCVCRLAQLAEQCGLDGVVCSAKEVEVLRNICAPSFKLVVPGLRPSWAGQDDQKRCVTPQEALRMGADYLVIGRPVTQANDPLQAVKRLAQDMASV